MSQRPGKTLVLNATFEPLAVVPLRRAVVLVLTERAEVIEEAASHSVRSERFSMGLPLVVRLLSMRRVPYTRRVPITRRSVVKRDHGLCAYCGGPGTTIDHVIPKAQGGLHSWRNVVCACTSCNGRKANRTPHEARMPLRWKPFEPAGIRAFVVVVSPIDEAWEPYLAAQPKFSLA